MLPVTEQVSLPVTPAGDAAYKNSRELAGSRVSASTRLKSSEATVAACRKGELLYTYISDIYIYICKCYIYVSVIYMYMYCT